MGKEANTLTINRMNMNNDEKKHKNRVILAKFPTHKEHDTVIAVYKAEGKKMQLEGYYAGSVGKCEFSCSMDGNAIKKYTKRAANIVLAKLRSRYPEVGVGSSIHNWRFILKDIEELDNLSTQ